MTDDVIANSDQELLPLRDDDHIQGGDSPEVTLVEYGDYECPGCGEAYQVIRRLEAEMSAALRFVFRHFPYSRLHPHAEQAAQVAEAAGEQDRFWEMHDILFKNQSALELDHLIRYAEQLSLDVEKFTEAVKSEKYLERVRCDFRSGVQNGVFGTPTIFLNGIRHNEDASYDSIMAAITRQREEQQPESSDSRPS